MRIVDVNPYVLVSAERARRLESGWRKPMPVLVRVNGEPKAKPWRINMMPTGDGSFRLYLHGVVRKASRTKVGERVRVDLEFDTRYRNGPLHAMPAWFRAPLRENLAAKSAWNALVPSRKKEILRYLSALKSDAARERNVARVLGVLSGKKARYMGRTWRRGR